MSEATEDPHNVMHVYEGDGGVIIRENGNVSSFGAQSDEVQAAFAAATTPPIAEAVAAEQVDYPRILYVCEHCQEHAPEMCGRSRDDIYVTPSGQWLCDECIDEEGVPVSDCVSPPALYPASTVAHLQQEMQRLKAAELAEAQQRYVDANDARIDAEAALAEARKALEEAREVVDACAGDNRPAREWAITVRDGIDAALAARRALAGGNDG